MAQAPCMTHSCRSNPGFWHSASFDFNVNRTQPGFQAAVAAFLAVLVTPKPFCITRQTLLDLRAVADSYLKDFSLRLPQNHPVVATASRNHGAVGIPRPQYRRA